METPQVIIQTDNASINSMGATKTAQAGDIDGALETIFPDSGILPPAVRWVSSNLHSVIVERPPFVARIGYRGGAAGTIAEGDAREYYLPVPWQVYGMTFSADWSELAVLNVYVRNSPLMDFEAPLYMFPYPNVFNTAMACLGKGFHDTYRAAEPNNMASAVNTVLNAFWTADFNEDAGPNTWTAPWRSPTASMEPDYRHAVMNQTIANATLMKYYANQPLEKFIQWDFGLSNSLNPDGDTVADLIAYLEQYNHISFKTSNTLYQGLRTLINTATTKRIKK